MKMCGLLSCLKDEDVCLTLQCVLFNQIYTFNLLILHLFVFLLVYNVFFLIPGHWREIFECKFSILTNYVKEFLGEYVIPIMEL